MTTYAQALLATQPASLIAYWPLNEISGAAMVNDAPSGSSYNGAYTGVTLADTAGPGASMGSAPYFDGVNDYANLYTAALAAAWSMSAGSFSFWFKPRVITPAVAYNLVRAVDGGSDANGINILIETTGTLTVKSNMGGTNKTITFSPISLAWHHCILTWDKTADTVKAALDGGTPSTGTSLGVPAGVLSSTRTALGSEFGNSASNPNDGWMQGVAVWSIALTNAEMLTVATANPTPVVATVTEYAAALNVTEAALRSNVTETLAPLNVTTQETAVLR